MCQNHNPKPSLKKGHKCDYDNDEHIKDCKPCRMTKDRRFAASKDKKNNYQKKKNFPSILKTEHSFGKKRLVQMCRKCANHGEPWSMKEHKNSCKFMFCPCADCIETEKRRKAVKQEAKAKRQTERVNKTKNQIKEENNESLSSCPSSPNDSGYHSDLSTSTSPNYTSYSTVSPVDCKFLEPMPYFGQNNFYQEEKKYSLDPNFLPSILTTDEQCSYYTNISSNTFHEIVSFPVKTEASETIVQNCMEFAMDESLLHNVVQGLINNEFDIEEVFDMMTIDDNTMNF